MRYQLRLKVTALTPSSILATERLRLGATAGMGAQEWSWGWGLLFFMSAFVIAKSLLQNYKKRRILQNYFANISASILSAILNWPNDDETYLLLSTLHQSLSTWVVDLFKTGTDREFSLR
ncbi:MAG: hypothetical protein K6G08_04425 [Prevotella sp.]|nr:hypothetical protein [Prevotella sp.]